MEIFHKIAAFFFDMIEVVVVALAIFVVVYLFLFQPHEVNGASMEPNFHNNEFILTDKISYRFRLPQRGDVIIFRAPKNRELDYIKRVIGLPGERVKIIDGSVYVNNQKLNEPYLSVGTVSNSGLFLPSNKEYLVLEDEYFVLGDNRTHSSDSREWGTVNRQDIVGKAWLRYWPPEVIGLIPAGKD